MVLTPFLLMGAMSPVTIPAALVQQLAEALSGIALAQLIRPGCPVIFGSFLSNIDMQSGSPAFGTPESAIGLLCTGQLARHFGLPFRTGGGLNSSQTADAQSAYEALMTLLPTFLAGTNFVMHAAGWLEGGLVSCYEKFIIDIELLKMLRVEFTPLEIDEAALAFGAHEEVGTAGNSSARRTPWSGSASALPADAVLYRELRALAQARRQGHRGPGRTDLAQEARRLRPPPSTTRSAPNSTTSSAAPPPRAGRIGPGVGPAEAPEDLRGRAPDRACEGRDAVSRDAEARTGGADRGDHAPFSVADRRRDGRQALLEFLDRGRVAMLSHLGQGPGQRGPVVMVWSVKRCTSGIRYPAISAGDR